MVDVRVCAPDDIAPDASLRVDIDGTALCVVRIGDDRWYCVNDTCSHEDYSLSDGEVWPDELEVECPTHGSTFSLLTGEPQSLPATRAVATYGVRVDDGGVFVTLPVAEVPS